MTKVMGITISTVVLTILVVLIAAAVFLYAGQARSVENVSGTSFIQTLKCNFIESVECNEYLKTRIAVLENDLAKSKQSNEKFAKLQEDLDSRYSGSVSIFKTHEDPYSDKTISIGTSYTDILSENAKHEDYWCYIGLGITDDGKAKSLQIKGVQGLVKNPDYSSSGLTLKSVEFARSVCKPYVL